MRHGGWYPRRRGILEHLERGDVSLLDIAIHDVLSLWADHQSGICWASAEKINALAPSEFSYKSVQRSLAKLERIGWIKRWMTKGKRGNYPVLVCRYFVRDASMTWISTSGERTTDWRDVKFDAVHDPSFKGPPGVRSDVRELGGEQSVVMSASQEGRAEKPDGSKSLTADDELTTDLVCSHEIKDVWKFCGVKFERLPKRFRTKDFDGIVRDEYANYYEWAHDGSECLCSPVDFLGHLRAKLTSDGVEYPPAFLARQVECEQIEHSRCNGAKNYRTRVDGTSTRGSNVA
jgi:hypothetical protein